MSENPFSANVYVSTIRSHELLMEWLARFSPGTLLNDPHKWLFSKILLAFECLLVFSISLWDRLHCYYHAAVAEVSICSMCWCGTTLAPASCASHEWEPVCRDGKEMLPPWGKDHACKLWWECNFLWTPCMTLNYGFPIPGPELKHVSVFLLGFLAWKFFVWGIF